MVLKKIKTIVVIKFFFIFLIPQKFFSLIFPNFSFSNFSGICDSVDNVSKNAKRLGSSCEVLCVQREEVSDGGVLCRHPHLHRTVRRGVERTRRGSGSGGCGSEAEGGGCRDAEAEAATAAGAVGRDEQTRAEDPGGHDTSFDWLVLDFFFGIFKNFPKDSQEFLKILTDFGIFLKLKKKFLFSV